MRLSIGGLVVLGLIVETAGCSSSSGAPAPIADAGSDAADVAVIVDSSPEADVQEAAASYPAPHAAPPQVINAGGPVLTAPKLVTVTFASDPLGSSLNEFAMKLGAAKAYWSGATAEYGVGPIASVVSYVATDSLPVMLDDTDIQAWLQAKLEGVALDGGAGGDAASDGGGGGPPLPANDANTVYMIYYPPSTTVTFQGSASCQQFDGYHSDFQLPDGSFVTYGVVAECPPMGPGLPEIDAVSATASHEYIEAATDPLPQDKPAWSTVDADHIAWQYVGGGGEIGDMCAAYPTAFYTPTDLPYLVQRVWSNKEAAASHDPCEPDGAEPYFNAVPVLNDTLTIENPMESPFTTKGVKIPVGKTATVELDLFSDGPTSAPIEVSALDIASGFFGMPQELSFTFDKTKGVNGDKIHMTIKVLAAGTGNVEPFWIQTQIGPSSGSMSQPTSIWVGLVGD